MTIGDGFAYSGVDNLEVMAEAERYNAFLTELVLAHARPGDRILDFGTGIGTFARPIAAAGYDVVCVEPDEAMVSRLREAGFDAETQPSAIPDGSIDYAYALNVFEHIEDDAASAREIRRMLSPGGRLLVYVPAFDLLFSSMDRKVCHFRRYTRSSLSDMIRACGFRVEKAQYADSLGFLASLAYKYLGSDKGDIDAGTLRFYDRWIFPASQTLDRVARGFCGKNVFCLAVAA